MKRFLNTIILLSALGSCYTNAHSDHGAISSEVALEIAGKSVQQLIFKDQGFEVGKLDSSWKSVGDSDLSLLDAEADFFVISVKNASSKEVIYFQISTSGQVLDVANTNRFRN